MGDYKSTRNYNTLTRIERCDLNFLEGYRYHAVLLSGYYTNQTYGSFTKVLGKILYSNQ